MHDHFDIVELLVTLMDVIYLDAQDNNGHTALMYASANGHRRIVKLLLDWRANPDIVGHNGSTALTVAKTQEIVDSIVLHSLHHPSHIRSHRRSQSVESHGGSSGGRSSCGSFYGR